MHRILTLSEVAVWLKVHPISIYRLLKKRAIPAFKVGSDWRFNAQDLELWLEEITSTQRQLARAPDRTQHTVAVPLKPK